ncbi:CmcI family methyltransferase [Geminocystis sp. NIES-3709]|uniref:CmcI family methyltransferase n=1 Tax=Geminocystis sp. NIES-3709 TaxID=1617448 RepID=UPI0005FC434B|nr:CmcI family methyltransferase [Geminocystis sp. NIES-3709]BAQ65666.1 HlpA protein [Geminocystis sp. NIES-3709]
MNKPLFSIIIPTRERHQTLPYAMRTVLNQSYNNFELIIMDNFSSKETYQAVHEFNDPRIKYYRSSERLSMSDNWELSLSKVQGDYVNILGDDDGLIPDALEIALNYINNYNINIVTWFRWPYYWDNAIQPENRNSLYVNLGKNIYLFNSREQVKLVYEGKLSYEYLPMIYSSFIPKKLTNKIQSIHGKYFIDQCLSPDIFSGIVNAYFSNQYLFSEINLSVSGISAYSNGISSAFPDLASKPRDQFITEIKTKNKQYIHPKLIECSNIIIGIGSDFLYAKDLFFPDDEEIKLNIEYIIQRMISHLNSNPSQYNVERKYIQQLADKWQVNLSKYTFPDLKNITKKVTSEEIKIYEGLIKNQETIIRLIINCRKFNIVDVSQAVILASAIMNNKIPYLNSSGEYYISENLVKAYLNNFSNDQITQPIQKITDDWQLTTAVAFFIFNRPETTARVFEVIREAKPTKLLVVADGARVDEGGEAEKCADARAIINQVDWECEILTNYSDVNLGCRKRIGSGLDWVFEQVEEAIVLEDDCLPHSTFFRYCQELLEKYRDDERIMMISGDNFQFGHKRTEYSYYFSRYGHIWGWATWRRAWIKNDQSMQLWPQLRDNHWLKDVLENDQAVTYWSRIFQLVYDGFNTWDYIWLFTLWANNGLTILPNVNLVSNIGFSSGTHTTTQNNQIENLAVEALDFPLNHPSFIIRNTQADNFTEETIFSGVIKKVLPVIHNNHLSMEKLISLINNNKNQEVINIINSNNENNLNYFYIKALAEIRLGYIYDAKNSLNQLLLNKPDHLKAQQLLKELSQESEKEVQQLLNQALNYFNQGERIKALRLGEKAASLGIFITGLHYLRSVFNSAVARYEEALEAAELELKYNPNHPQAREQVTSLTKALIKPKKEKIPNNQRTWGTSLPYDLMMSIQNSLHNYSYSGVPIQKNPFDFAIYPVLIWNLKPRTIIEIGSKSGGSAIWFGDLFDNFKIDGHIYSVDIVKVTKYSHGRVTFLEGDGQNLQETFSPDFLQKLPRPLLVIEDADHSYQTSKAVLEFFHPYLDRDEYIVIEDGIISDIVKDQSYSSGPHQALKTFLANHNSEYEIDGDYCDFFGYNLTWATNGYLKKLTSANIQPLNSLESKGLDLSNNFIYKANEAFNNGIVEEAFKILNEAKAKKQPILGLDYLRAKCFLHIKQPPSSIQSLYEELRYFPDNNQAKTLLEQLLKQYPQFVARQIQDSEFQELYQEIQPYTMLSEARLYSLFTLVKRVCLENISGNFVECGVAGGGSTGLISAIVKRYTKQPRQIYAFDSFEGMPTPTDKDKSSGIPAELTGWSTGTCAAPEDSVTEICNKLGSFDILHLVKGYFEDTLPKMRDQLGVIAFLHMDGDWYSSTQAIINNLYDRISPYGYIQIDDYGFWEGCRQAITEFQQQNNLKFNLNVIDSTGVWFAKSEVTPLNFIQNQQSISKRIWLNLGCGSCFHPDWTNIDFYRTGEGVIAHNLLKGIPFPDNSFEVVYHSHLLEHLPKNEAQPFLQECYRVLQSKGIIRVVIPNLEQIVRLYLTSLEKALEGSKEDADNYNWLMLEMYDQVVRNESGGDMKRYLAQNPIPNEKFIIERFGVEGEMLINAFKGRNFPYVSLAQLNPTQIGQFRQGGEVHQWMYDRYSLRILLETVGFVDVKVCRADESRIIDFNTYHLDVLPDGRVRKSDSLFMEAIKP